MPLHKTNKPQKKAGAKSASGKNAKVAATAPAAKTLPGKTPAAKVPPAKTPAGKATTAKTMNGKNGQPAKSPSQPSAAKLQLQAFERAIQLLHKRSYRDARDWFEKARQGPGLEIAANAATHIRMCDSRLAAPAPEPKSAEEHYNYAVALINLRDLGTARRHLEVALQMEPRADHVHYALAVCHALSGDSQPAYDSLKRAIDLQPRNRMAARQDSDLEKIGKQIPFHSLLYPEKE
jgi:tetratricopeptide (TPR) repeat protein